MTADLQKLIKLMQLTQSANDAEALAAVRKANALLAKSKMNWDQFLTALHNAAQRQRSGIEIILTSTTTGNMPFWQTE